MVGWDLRKTWLLFLAGQWPVRGVFVELASSTIKIVLFIMLLWQQINQFLKDRSLSFFLQVNKWEGGGLSKPLHSYPVKKNKYLTERRVSRYEIPFADVKLRDWLWSYGERDWRRKKEWKPNEERKKKKNYRKRKGRKKNGKEIERIRDGAKNDGKTNRKGMGERKERKKEGENLVKKHCVGNEKLLFSLVWLVMWNIEEYKK